MFSLGMYTSVIFSPHHHRYAVVSPAGLHTVSLHHICAYPNILGIYNTDQRDKNGPSGKELELNIQRPYSSREECPGVYYFNIF